MIMSAKPPTADVTRTVGRRSSPIRLRPSGDALRVGIRFVEEFRAVGTAGVGLSKGVYRYRTHEEMNRADDERIARALADTIRSGSEGSPRDG